MEHMESVPVVNGARGQLLLLMEHIRSVTGVHGA